MKGNGGQLNFGFLSICILIQFVALNLVGCRTSKEAGEFAPVGKDVELTALRSAIQREVRDADRASSMLVIVDFMEVNMGKVNKANLSLAKDLVKDAADHGVDAAELGRELRNLDHGVRLERRQVIARMFEMKGLATREEWPPIANAFVESIFANSDRARASQQRQARDKAM